MRLLLFLLLACQQLHAQQAFTFRKGLACSEVHQYAREAVYTDLMAHQLYTSTLQPEPGKPIIPGSDKIWKELAADSNGTFQSNALAAGYLYLQYNSPKEQKALFMATGNAMVFINGVPHAGDPYRYGWMQIPVELKKGTNHFLLRSFGMGSFASITARLLFPVKPIFISAKDATLPFLVSGETNTPPWAGLVLTNTSSTSLADLQMEATIEGRSIVTKLPGLHAMGSRKMPVMLPVPAEIRKGTYRAQLRLLLKNKLIDTSSIDITAVNKGEHASYTFISSIDSSVQYYAVAPQTKPTASPALFLSVHGAEVEAISQARAYTPKEEGPIVAPTNRRPRGFNWEDWGRLDALEVLDIAKNKFKPDPSRIYLTGHSMGGHGTWYLGATYPGYWAAIAPCAGYPTLATYGSHDGRIPTIASTPAKQMLTRASNASNVFELANNYKASGIYILHGDSDKTVSVDYARQMKKLLADFHPDFTYYEYPGGSHWYGNESVDWLPLFQYLLLHRITPADSSHIIDFSTASPSISASYKWIALLQQHKPYQYSRVKLQRDLVNGTITGTTENVRAIQLDLSAFTKDSVRIQLDGQQILLTGAKGTVTLINQNNWQQGPAPSAQEKGPHRNGGFKEAFQHHMIFVYGTRGNKEENAWALNKARFDAETWYYRGNGAVDIIPDVEFLKGSYPDRGIILYGNMTTNAAAAVLLRDCPIRVERGRATAGNYSWESNDLGAYYTWPNPSSPKTSIALIGGTGMNGMRAANANQYFASGSGFPDFLIFHGDMLRDGDQSIKAAGYFNSQWAISGDAVLNK